MGAISPPRGFFSQELMNPCSNFLLLDQKQLPSVLPVDVERIKEPVLLTGLADPLSIQLSYYQPSDTTLDVIMLEIACYNLTSLALSDFELRICPIGNTAKCIDAFNDLKVRILPAGGSVSSTLLPFGLLKAEKRFQICKFARASFHVQVTFSDANVSSSSSEQQDQEPATEIVPTRLAMSDPFVVHFDALFSTPRAPSATASFFHSQWQRYGLVAVHRELVVAAYSLTCVFARCSAQATVQIPVRSRACDTRMNSAANALSMCQRVLQHQSPRIAVISELLVDLPFYCHVCIVCILTKDPRTSATKSRRML
jgi:hypothetical protein